MYKTAIDFSRLRILIVENHALMRRLLGEMLRGFGVQQVDFARDVPGAVEHVYSEKYDAVILDFFLGDLDGADFARHIRHDADCLNREVPILLITGMPDHHKVMKVLDAGINGMLAKPIAAKDLYDRIHVMLAKPRPFVITSDYVGPMRSRSKVPICRRMRPAGIPHHAPARPVRKRADPAYEDGILI